MKPRTSWVLVSMLAACSGKQPPAPQTAQTVQSQSEAQVEAPKDAVIRASVPLMPRAVTSFGAAVLEGAVYALGGYHGTPHAYSREGQSGALWRLSLADGSWTELPGTEPAQGAPLVAFGDLLVRAGGMRALNAQGEPERLSSLDEVSAFDPRTQRWSAWPVLPEARSSHAAVALGNQLFVLGGWTLSDDRGKRGTFAERGFAFDPGTQQWRDVEQPFQRRALALAVLDGHIVALGGITPEGETSREVHVYDPAQKRWSQAQDLPSDGFGIAAASRGDVLYASARDGALYALASIDGAWKKVQHLAFPRFFHQLVMPDDAHVVALGGISGMHFGARIRPVETLELERDAPMLITFTLENPLRGRNRQGAFVSGDSLYVFGGNRSLAQHDFAPEDFVADAGRLDLAGLFWDRLPDFPKARQTVQTVVLDDRALSVGGFGHDGEAARAQADAYAFSLEQEQWQAAPNQLEAPRTQFGLTAQGDNLWIFGGLDFDPKREGAAQFDHPRSVLKAPLNGPFATSGIELPRPRRAFGGAQLEGRYYLVGGMAEGFAPVTTCDVFAFADQTWSEIPCPSPRVSPQLVAAGGKLYLAGGSTPGPEGLVENTAVEVFDPQTQKWSTLLDRLPITPRNLSMFAFGENLLLYSAHNEEGVVHVAVLRLPTTASSEAR